MDESSTTDSFVMHHTIVYVVLVRNTNIIHTYINTVQLLLQERSVNDTYIILRQADDLGDFPSIKQELLTYSDVEIDALAKDRIKKDNHNMSK